MTRQIGPYEVLRPIGEGAMGAVYEARDTRLDRCVALKLMTASSDDSRERFWREAKLAARVNHPNVCHIYDVGESEGQPYLAMELLSGEPLASRIERGPVPPSEALTIVADILAGLQELHSRGIVHRDLKPSNVFLVGASQGSRTVKLLDFGLALPMQAIETELTQPGMILGTPRYMAPEQWTGDSVGPASDLFAVAAILFELLTGRPAFDGKTAIELYQAVVGDRPPALTGDSMIEAVDRVLHRALAKAPGDRYPSAAAMKDALDACLIGSDRTLATPVEVRTVARLLVLPFRLLRPDEEIDFLSSALSDAVIASLSGMHSLVVHSGGGKSAAQPLSLEDIAAQGKVDAVLTGSLLRSGERVRLVTQLLEVPSGTVLASTTEDATLDDIFRLQDELVEKVTRSLAVPLGERQERQQRLDVPTNGEAYERYLRANDLATGAVAGSRLRKASELYRACLELDPEFAPAWAQLGRVERLLAKYGEEQVDASQHLRQAELAFDRALAANPDLPLAHNLFTYHQIEELGDPPGAMVRLLRQVGRLPDPNLYAGLVGALRFCGLATASLAAHQQARRLDPHIPTSVSYTYWVLGDYVRAGETETQDIPFMKIYSMVHLDRLEDVHRIWSSIKTRDGIGTEKAIFGTFIAAIDGDSEACLAWAREVLDSSFNDPEGLFFVAQGLGQAGHVDLALEVLADVVERGFHCLHLLPSRASFAALDEDERFLELRRRSEAGSEEARRRFLANDGERLLGVNP